MFLTREELIELSGGRRQPSRLSAGLDATFGEKNGTKNRI